MKSSCPMLTCRADGDTTVASSGPPTEDRDAGSAETVGGQNRIIVVRISVTVIVAAGCLTFDSVFQVTWSNSHEAPPPSAHSPRGLSNKGIRPQFGPRSRTKVLPRSHQAIVSRWPRSQVPT